MGYFEVIVESHVEKRRFKEFAALDVSTLPDGCKGNMKLMVLYHATITGSAIIIDGFLKTVKTPQAVVLEAVVSVSLFLIVTVILYATSWKEKAKMRN